MGEANRKILTMERDWIAPAAHAASPKGSAEAVARSSLRLVPRGEKTVTPEPKVQAVAVEPAASWWTEGIFAVLALGAALTFWLSTR